MVHQLDLKETVQWLRDMTFRQKLITRFQGKGVAITGVRGYVFMTVK